MSPTPFCLVRIAIVSCCLSLVADLAYSQIIPDRTTNTSIVNDCQNTCQINDGNLAGDNLFHSFEAFNLQAGESAYFADPGVANIFSRVTGNHPSQIFGILGVSGDANLFLLNPNGIIFGAGAALDLNGSFLATTADRIQFGDRGSFAAIPNSQENLALLTVNPDVFFFDRMDRNRPIETLGGSFLTVAEGQNITLLGGQTAETSPGLNIEETFLQAPQGNINLSAIAGSGKIELKEDFKLESVDDIFQGDITISGETVIDVSSIGAGSIQLQGKNISLTERSQLSANTLGNLDGGSIDITASNFTLADNSEVIAATIGEGNSPDIRIDAKEQVNLIGNDISAFQSFLFNTVFLGDRSNNSSSVVYSFSLGSGRAGNITIDSQDLTVANGAWILASTINNGNTGDLTINTSGNVTIDGSGVILGSALNSSGNVSQLNLNSENLTLQNGGIISSSTLGSGQGGNINLAVLDSIHLRESLPAGLAPTGIYTNTLRGIGQAGDLNLNAKNLTLEDGSQLSSASGLFFGEGVINTGGEGGNITVNVENSLKISGASSNGFFSSGIVNNTFSDRPAGNISIKTRDLNIQGRGTISASAFGIGEGGNIDIEAYDSVNLTGIGFNNLQQSYFDILNGNTDVLRLTGGLLTYTTTGEKGGDITIATPQLTLESGAIISSSTFDRGLGGDLNFTVDNLEILDSAITSAALGRGESGDIKIDANNLQSNAVIASSSAGTGDSGNIDITARDSVRLVGNQPNSFLASGIFSNSSGLSYPGNLTINTNELVILDGNIIDASNDSVLIPTQNIDMSDPSLNFNLANNLEINARSIEIAGSNSALSIDGTPDRVFHSGIVTTTSSPFAASNITINTSDLSIADKGEISVSSTGVGRAGNLEIVADSIELDNLATLSGRTLSGTGGNINLQVKDIVSVTNNSKIDTNAENFGNGGNITIDTNFAIAAENSQISANALSGQGGNIDIMATDLFLSSDSSITASSELGIDGEVNLKTFNTSDRNSVVNLPKTTLKADETIVSSCGDRNISGSFAYTGKGGLPSNPLREYSLGDRDLLVDFNLSTLSESDVAKNLETKKLSLISPSKIVEMGGWTVNSRGKVELIASSDRNLSNNNLISSICPLVKNQ